MYLDCIYSWFKSSESSFCVSENAWDFQPIVQPTEMCYTSPGVKGSRLTHFVPIRLRAQAGPFRFGRQPSGRVETDASRLGCVICGEPDAAD